LRAAALLKIAAMVYSLCCREVGTSEVVGWGIEGAITQTMRSKGGYWCAKKGWTDDSLYFFHPLGAPARCYSDIPHGQTLPNVRT
jgi:hypothetical protein